MVDLTYQRVLSGNAQVPTASPSNFMVMSVKMHQKEEEMRIKFGTGAEQKLVVRQFEASSSHPPVEPLAMPSFETAAGLEEVEEALGDHALDEIPKEHDDEFDEADAPWHAEYDIDGVV